MKKFLSALMISSMLIPTAFAADSYSEGYYVAKVTANIRAQASMQGQRIGYIQENDELYVRGQKGQWCDVEYRTYEHAYVLCSLLEAETYTSDDYYDQDYTGNDDMNYDDNMPPLPMHMDMPMHTMECDVAKTTCSADFKVGITADLHNSSPYEDFHDIKLNLHGQGRVNMKDSTQHEASLNLNGSFRTELGSVQGSAQLVVKDKIYVRFDALQAMNIPDISASITKDIQDLLIGRWFTLPMGDMHMLHSSSMFMPMSGPSAQDINGLISISRFVGKDISGTDTRYHYQTDLNEQKIAQLIGEDAMTTLTNNLSQATVNFWLDSNQRLVSGNIALKIIASDLDPISGTVTLDFNSSNLNQDIHVTTPDNAQPLPQSLPHENNPMLL